MSSLDILEGPEFTQDILVPDSPAIAFKLHVIEPVVDRPHVSRHNIAPEIGPWTHLLEEAGLL